MEKLNILFGFSDEKFEAAVRALLRSKGYDAQISARFSKDSIKSYIEKNPDTDAVVILEAWTWENMKPQKYTAEEVTQLTDMSHVNVILVLSINYKGTDYMRTLLAAGITSAFFQEEGGGARPRDIVKLILQKRTRKSAREYYGIGSQIELGFLDSADFSVFYNELKENDEITMLEKYLAVCSRMTAQQIADFTRRLPDDDKAYLAQFEEFHTVMQLLKKFGIDMKIKRPKKVCIGLSHAVGISLKDERIEINPNEGEVEKIKKEEKAHESVKKRLFGKKAGGVIKNETEIAMKADIVGAVPGEDAVEFSKDILEEPQNSAFTMADILSAVSDVADEEEDEVVFFDVSSDDEMKEKSGEDIHAMREAEKTEAQFEEEEDPEEIMFDDMDETYDDLVICSGNKRRFSILFIFAIIFFIAILLFVLVMGQID